jgi:hypothetical protein
MYGSGVWLWLGFYFHESNLADVTLNINKPPKTSLKTNAHSHTRARQRTDTLKVCHRQENTAKEKNKNIRNNFWVYRGKQCCKQWTMHRRGIYHDVAWLCRIKPCYLL